MRVSYPFLGALCLGLLVLREILRHINAITPVIPLETSTYIFAVSDYLTILFAIVVARQGRWQGQVAPPLVTLFKFYMVMVAVTVLRGLLTAQDYWDYKGIFISDLPFYLMPWIGLIGMRPLIVLRILRFVLIYLYPAALLLIPLALEYNEETYSRVVITSSFLVCFIPFLARKHQITIILTVTLSIVVALSFRSGLIKNGFAILLLMSYLVGIIRTTRSFLIAQNILFLIPLGFLVLGYSGIYNIFKPANTDQLSLVDGRGVESNFLADTRTFIYREIAAELDNTDAWLFGKGAGGSYNSIFSANDSGGAVAGKRYSSEVGLMNRLLKGGLVEVFVYSIIIYWITRATIINSQNALAKLLAVLVAARWSFSFFEEYTQFDMNFFFLYILMGMISSFWFQKMSDAQVKKYLQGL